MTKRRSIGAASDPTGIPAAKDDLTRLVKMIARQAAREAFYEFVALERETPLRHRSASSSLGQAPKETAQEPDSSPEPGERFLGVAEVAKRLGVAEKTVRRKIDKGELPAVRVGNLVRVGERDLAAYVGRSRLDKRENR
jgi:excisionase family DNA binding protein